MNKENGVSQNTEDGFNHPQWDRLLPQCTPGHRHPVCSIIIFIESPVPLKKGCQFWGESQYFTQGSLGSEDRYFRRLLPNN